MKLHPLCKLFPAIADREFDDLVEDIRLNGLAEPITTLDDQILDGRNRYDACIEAKVEPRFAPFTGKDPLAFVLSKNLNRRHLDTSQRAMVAVEIAKWKQGQNQHESGRANLPTLDQAAEQMNVGRRTVVAARAIQKASPKLARQVKAGKLTVNAAQAMLNPKPEPGLASVPPAALSVPPGADTRIQHLTIPQMNALADHGGAPPVSQSDVKAAVAQALAVRLERFNAWLAKFDNPYASTPPFTRVAAREFVTKLLS